jgi:hypothetical protein
MFPSKAVVVPSVAELPTCQKMLVPGIVFAPWLSSTTELPEAVVRVDPIWKTKTGSFRPSSLR